MRFSHIIAPAALLATASAQVKGFNYGSTNIDGSARVQSQWVDHFNKAKSLAGASGFASARLFTTVQAGTTNAPIEAIPAAISTDTSLLLGLWASAGDASFANEIAALQAAISQYGTAFTDRVVGISVGSEDMYRISPKGVDNLSGPGVGPDVIANYVGQVRAVIANTGLNGKPIGHVDTWTAWANSSNVAAVNAVDFLGMDAYPYYETENGNDISNALSLFNSAISQTEAASQGKPVWVTETGWPTTGETLAQAVPNVANAKSYWDAVGCGVLFGNRDVWWFTLEDPNFGVVGTSINNAPLWDLTCPAPALVLPFSYDSSTTASSTARTKTRSSMRTISAATTRAPTSKSLQSVTSRSLRSTRSNSSLTFVYTVSGASASTLRRSTRPSDLQISTRKPFSATISTRAPRLGLKFSDALTPKDEASGNFGLLKKQDQQANCPIDLEGTFISPRAILPITKLGNTNKTFPADYGFMSNTISTIYTFEIPPRIPPTSICQLVFLLHGGRYTLLGSGFLLAYLLEESITNQTIPAALQPKSFLGWSAEIVTSASEGFNLGGGACGALRESGLASVLIEAVGGLNLTYYQTRGEPAVGAWLRIC